MCHQARCSCKQSLLDHTVAFVDSTSRDVPCSKDEKMDCPPNPSNSCLVWSNG